MDQNHNHLETIIIKSKLIIIKMKMKNKKS